MISYFFICLYSFCLLSRVGVTYLGVGCNGVCGGEKKGDTDRRPSGVQTGANAYARMKKKGDPYRKENFGTGLLIA